VEEPACKPDSVPGPRGPAAAISLTDRGVTRAPPRSLRGPSPSRGLPGSIGRAVRSLLGLAPGGVCRAGRSPGRW